jgi:hypothetical protein
MSYNFSALTMTVTPQMIKEHKASQEIFDIDKMVKYVAITLIGGVLLAFLVSLLSIVRSGRSSELAITATGYGVGIGLLLTVWYVYRLYQFQFWKQALRVYTFAVQNNFKYSGQISEPELPGMFFNMGHSKRASHVVSGSTDSTDFQFANYTYTTGSGKNTRTYTIGYIQIQLERQLPHIVLDAVKNNARMFGFNSSNLPIAYSKDQAMRLEGDFNDHFQLYAPAGYERDALYVFTPDLMALFIDVVGVYDAEIVDDKLFIYAPMGIQYEDVTYMERIFQIIDVVGKKTIRRTDRYQDERTVTLYPNVVAEEGRRLRTSSVASVILFIVAVLFVGYYLVRAFSA